MTMTRRDIISKYKYTPLCRIKIQFKFYKISYRNIFALFLHYTFQYKKSIEFKIIFKVVDLLNTRGQNTTTFTSRNRQKVNPDIFGQKVHFVLFMKKYTNSIFYITSNSFIFLIILCFPFTTKYIHIVT